MLNYPLLDVCHDFPLSDQKHELWWHFITLNNYYANISLFLSYIYNVPAWSFYYVFHVNSFLTAVSFCQSTHFLAYHIDFIFMSPVRIDDPRPSIILIKSICHIIVQHSSKSVLILHLKLRLVSKLASVIRNPSCINRVFKARKWMA